MLYPGSPQFRSLLSPLEEEEEEEEPSGLEKELRGIRTEITVIADKIRADAATAKLESEWKFAAMVSPLIIVNGKFFQKSKILNIEFRCWTDFACWPSQPSPSSSPLPHC